MKELDIMMTGMSEEQKQHIRDKADRLEVLFKDDILCMKDVYEEWCDGMLPKDEVIYMKDKDEGWDGMLPKGDAVIINETTNNKGNK